MAPSAVASPRSFLTGSQLGSQLPTRHCLAASRGFIARLDGRSSESRKNAGKPCAPKPRAEKRYPRHEAAMLRRGASRLAASVHEHARSPRRLALRAVASTGFHASTLQLPCVPASLDAGISGPSRHVGNRRVQAPFAQVARRGGNLRRGYTHASRI